MAVLKNKGFTLIELVVGMAVLAIAMLLMSTMLVSQSKNSLEPLHHLRASQFGEAILQNVLSFPYDAINNEQKIVTNTDDLRSGGFESIFRYVDILGHDLSKQYSDYQVKIVVFEEFNTEIELTMKRIDVIMKTPSDEEIVFSALKGRY